MKPQRRNRYLILSIIIVLIITLTPGDGNVAGKYLDKLVHFIIFLILSINISYKYYKTEKLTSAIILAIIFGLLSEVTQQFIPGRGMDIYDGIADTLGVAGGYYLYRTLHLKFDKVFMKFRA